TNRKENIIAIPLQSITTRSDLLSDSVKTALGTGFIAEQVFVIKEDNTVELRQITTGIQDLGFIEVLTGLKEGETIVTAPFTAISKTLKDGKPVKIKEKEESGK
ncbi:MAG: hypothetical protein WC077_00170, partial [Bacteroidales bacterium]